MDTLRIYQGDGRELRVCAPDEDAQRGIEISVWQAVPGGPWEPTGDRVTLSTTEAQQVLGYLVELVDASTDSRARVRRSIVRQELDDDLEAGRAAVIPESVAGRMKAAGAVKRPARNGP